MFDFRLRIEFGSYPTVGKGDHPSSPRECNDDIRKLRYHVNKKCFVVTRLLIVIRYLVGSFFFSADFQNLGFVWFRYFFNLFTKNFDFDAICIFIKIFSHMMQKICKKKVCNFF